MKGPENGRCEGGIRIFARRFLRDPKNVGAICPSSRFLARRMIEAVPLVPGETVVEFGPGTGPFTRAILDALPPRARYIAIERDPHFAAHLGDRFPDLDLCCDGVENLVGILRKRGLKAVDRVISGIPFASLPAEVTAGILRATRSALRPGGTFTTFQYVHAYGFTSARLFRMRMRDIFGPLASRTSEFRNLPPAFVFTWRKPENGAGSCP